MEYFEIVTPRLTLRPIGMGDLETTHAYASDRENCRYMMFLPNDTLEETRQFIGESGKFCRNGFCAFDIEIADGYFTAFGIQTNSKRFAKPLTCARNYCNFTF